MPLSWSEDADIGIQLRNRQIVGTAQWGRRKKLQSFAMQEADQNALRFEGEFFDGDPELIPSPHRGLRWGGVCRFLPMPWANAMKDRVALYRNVRAVCLSCHSNILPPVPVLPYIPGEMRKHFVQMETTSGTHALACASDHDREFLNHQIVLLTEYGDEIGRSPYSPLSMSWG